jgi:hypothetical protein
MRALTQTKWADPNFKELAINQMHVDKLYIMDALPRTR